MKYSITENYITVPWSDGITNAPPNLITAAKLMAEQALPATFAKLEGNPSAWVILSTNETSNQLFVAHRG